jgi:transcriptional regulator with XRE-family HTH domain
MFAGERMNEQLEYATSGTSASTPLISRQYFEGFADREYRSAYVDEHLNTFLPFQIRALREQRDWTQGQLGEYCGGKAQGWISKLEDPNYGKFSLATLKTLERAFDCMLDVRFKSYRDFSDEQDRRRPGDLRVNSYEDDAAQGDVEFDQNATQAQQSLFKSFGTTFTQVGTARTGKNVLMFRPKASTDGVNKPATLKQGHLFVENVA